MRRNNHFISLLLVVTILTGCHAGQLSKTSTNEIKITKSRELTSMAKKYAECTTVEASNFEKEHYLDIPESMDLLMCAERYINGLNIYSDAVDLFAGTYSSAQQIEAYPILGRNLESTDLIAYLFYVNNIPTSVGILQINESGTVVRCYALSDGNDAPAIVGTLQASMCYSSLIYCIESFPDFKISGLVFDTQGYATVYPIGIKEGETAYKYYSYWHDELYAFSRVAPFSSIKEGRIALQSYLLTQKEIWSNIVVYPWTKAELYNTGYLEPLKYSFAQQNNYPSMDLSYLSIYDSVVAIPLIDNNLNEDVYALHLLYYRNQLIAEIVIQRVVRGDSIEYIPVWENVKSKDSFGNYIPIEKSKYTDVLERAYICDSSWVGKGVVFDGQFIPVGYKSDVMMFYNMALDSLTAID